MAAAMLARLYADNYRCLVNFELRPGRVNLLFGDNGSGKTSLLDLLWSIKGLSRGGDDANLLFGLSRCVWESRTSQRFELEVEGNGGVYVYALELQHTQLREQSLAEIRTESVLFDGKPLFRYAEGSVQLFNDDGTPGATFPFTPKRSFLASIESGGGNTRLSWFLGWLGSVTIFKLDPAAILGAGSYASRESPYISRTGDNFAAFYRQLVQERPEVAEAAQNELRERLASFKRLRLFPYNEAKYLQAEFSHADGRTFSLPFSLLSDGQAVLAVLYTLLQAHASRASLLCLDEPDNFLALPEIQPWLLRLTESLDASQSQAIVLSHHPEMIDYLAADSAFYLERRQGGLTRISPAHPDLSAGLKLSELVARGWHNGDAAE